MVTSLPDPTEKGKVCGVSDMPVESDDQPFREECGATVIEVESTQAEQPPHESTEPTTEDQSEDRTVSDR